MYSAMEVVAYHRHITVLSTHHFLFSTLLEHLTAHAHCILVVILAHARMLHSLVA